MPIVCKMSAYRIVCGEKFEKTLANFNLLNKGSSIKDKRLIDDQ